MVRRTRKLHQVNSCRAVTALAGACDVPRGGPLSSRSDSRKTQAKASRCRAPGLIRLRFATPSRDARTLRWRRMLTPRCHVGTAIALQRGEANGGLSESNLEGLLVCSNPQGQRRPGYLVAIRAIGARQALGTLFFCASFFSVPVLPWSRRSRRGKWSEGAG